MNRLLADGWLNYTVSLATLGYFLGLGFLAVRAQRFPASPGQTFHMHHILQPDRFSPEGQRPRRATTTFMFWGGLMVLGLWIWAMNR